MTLGMTVFLLALAVAGIVLVFRYLRKSRNCASFVSYCCLWSCWFSPDISV